MNNARVYFLAFVLALGAGTGCTVRPAQVHSRAVAFDGSTQNAGFLGFDAAGNGIITNDARDKFNGLVVRYGKLFVVPLAKDDGVSPGASSGTWTITPASLVKFQTMNRWLRNGLPPSP